MVGNLLKMANEPDQVQSQFSPECELDRLENLKSYAERHISFSGLYLPMLRRYSEPYGSKKNPFAWKTLKEGSYYLGNAYDLVKRYKDFEPGSIVHKSIQSINDMLVALEFDPKHITSGYTDEAYGGKAKCFVSRGQGTKYYELLHSELKEDVRLFIAMVKGSIDVPVQRLIASINQRLQCAYSENLLEAIKEENLLAIENCIKKRMPVDFKDTDGNTPLHYAVNNGNIDVVNDLLENGADVAEITNKGYTPLHIASSKGYREVVEVLLQHSRREELIEFINARTTSSGNTSLHVAAKNGFFEVVKSLLKRGAIYNIENKEGKKPLDLSRDKNITSLFKLIEELFENAKIGNVDIINKLRIVEQDEFLAVTNARNNQGYQGYTLLQVAIANKHEKFAGKLLKMLRQPHQVQSQFSPECELNDLENLKDWAERHIWFSELYLPMLRSMSAPYHSEKNTFPWKTVKEGSYYLGNAEDLVRIYKDCVPGPIDNKNIQSVNDMLVELEFDRSHITSGYTDEAYGGQTECFVSKGQGTKYYELLHSDLKKDVRSFIRMVERNIDAPVKRFIESIKQRLQSAFSEKLLEATKNDDPLEIENCIKKGALVTFEDTDGRTPLHYAVNNGNIDVVSNLLKNGAEVVQITNKGNTPLHIASSKGYREIVEVLLRHVNRDELNDFVNAKTTSGGTTSLHVAAKNGFLEVVKSLLRRGAIYNIKNKEGKTPLDLSGDQNITDLLKLVEELFENAKIGNVEIIDKLRAVKRDEFLAVTSASNNQENTLLQVAIADGRWNVASKLSKMLKEPEEKLKRAAEGHIRFSELYLPLLRSMSEPYDSEKNPLPWKTLKDGSYYLGNAHHLVKVYKDYLPGLIDNENIQSVNDMLVALEFDPNHITTGYTHEAYEGKHECFVSNGQGTKYYELLHSDLKKDVRSFIEMVELNIDVPVKRFLESIS